MIEGKKITELTAEASLTRDDLFLVGSNGTPSFSNTTLGDILDFISREINLYDKIYPVGSFYMTERNVNPADLFGGVWEEVKGRFLMARTDVAYTPGMTGGGTGVFIEEENLPPHSHTIPAHKHVTNNHTHTILVSDSDSLITDHAGAHAHKGYYKKDAASSSSGNSRYAPSGTGFTASSGELTAKSATHAHSIPAHGHGASCQSGGAGYTQDGGNGVTGNTGSHRALSTMPPFLVVYVWKRTA